MSGLTPSGSKIAQAIDGAESIYNTSQAATGAAAKPITREAGKPARAKKERRPRQKDGIVALTDGCKFWVDDRQKAYSAMKIKGIWQNWPVRSEFFKIWLTGEAYEKNGFAPSGQVLDESLRTIEAMANRRGERRSAWLRYGQRGNTIYLDLANDTWEAVEINFTIKPHGWRIISGEGLPFIRSARTREMVRPEPDGNLADLSAFFNFAGPLDEKMTIGWLLAAARPKGPYPLCSLSGEQGTGKSTFSRRLRDLIDAGTPAIQAAPKDEQDLILAAQNSHIIALDNVSHIDNSTSDALCRLATGSGFATRALFSNGDEWLFEGCNPIVLNGIGEFAERADLADRSFKIHLAPIADQNRLTEAELDALWAAELPKFTGAIYTALACALENLPSTRVQNAGRMADAEHFITAAEPALRWPSGTFSAAYRQHRRDNAETTFEADPIAATLVKWFEHTSGTWEGSATRLLEILTSEADSEKSHMRTWPKNANSMGTALSRAAPLLRAKGIEIHRTHSGHRTITIKRKGEQP